MPLKISDTNSDRRYTTWIELAIDLISPKNLFLIGGRGTGKTANILAKRSMKISEDMPGSYQAFVAATYEDAHRNIIPTLVEGWNRNGWVEGRDYVLDQRPPDHFKLPYKKPLTFNHTISLKNGVYMAIASLDQVSSVAGNSFQHLYGDETKYHNPEKLKKLTPAMRGYVEFCNSIYYRGWSFTTDMPDVMEKEYDWILQREKDYNAHQAELAMRAALEINKEIIQIKKCIERGQLTAAEKRRTVLQDWMIQHYIARNDLTFFYVVSSYANADILTEGYFDDVYKALGPEEFRKSVLSLKPELNRGEAFYPTLGEHHFYEDGTKQGFYDKVPLGDKIVPTWRSLKYLDPNLPIDCGVDFGNQMSMIIGQQRGNYYYVLKEFFTLDPDNIDDLGETFISYFKGFPSSLLRAFYDRSGNQNKAVKRDWATWLKNSIETNRNGTKSGWTVELMSLNQGTIGQDQEHLFMKRMLGEYNEKLPKIKIDSFQCPNFKSSLLAAKTEVKKDRNNSAYIGKDKSSEKRLKGLNLVKYSTNFSDAGKYLFCRREWQRIMNARPFLMADPKVIG
jgi:hypothetical protein